MRNILLLIAVLVFLAAACALSGQVDRSVEPTLTLVPTIFIPTSTILSQAAPVPAAATATATTAAASSSPTPVPSLTPAGRSVPPGVVNIMVLGSDARAGSGHRTDVIMLVSIKKFQQSVSVISFPRDLYVPIPDWTTRRINEAEPLGGFETLADTMDENFAVRPSHYVLANFSGFITIIDRMNGIDVYAWSNLTDRCDLPQAVNGKCTIQAGQNHMDGATALWYVRSRYTSSDLDRLRREQEVLSAIFLRIMSTKTQDWASLFALYKEVVETNLTLQDIIPLLPTAVRVYNNRDMIRSFTLTVNEAKPYVTDTGAQVLLPDYDAINKILDEAIFSP